MKMAAPESRGPPRPSADLQAGSGRLRDDRAEDPGNRPALCPILGRHWFGVGLQDVREVYWNQVRLGNRLPVEPGVIALDGARR